MGTILIEDKLHSYIKLAAKKDGRLLSSFVDRLLKKALVAQWPDWFELSENKEDIYATTVLTKEEI